MSRHVPILILTLREGKHRQEEITKDLDRLGLKGRFVFGVDGNNASDEDRALYDSKAAQKAIGRDLLPGEFGCALSHVRIMEEVAGGDHEMVLVVEDDVFVGRMFSELLSHLDRLPPDWGLVNLFATNECWRIGDPLFDNYSWSTFRDDAKALGTVAYLIRKSAAKKLLTQAYPIRMPADFLTSSGDLGELKRYGVHPAVVAHKSFHSQIWTQDFPPRSRFWVIKSLFRRGFMEQARAVVKELRRRPLV